MKCWHNKNTGLLIIRIVVGIIFIYFGWMKVADMTATVAGFASMGFSAFWAYVASYVELLGGVSLILGYGSKIAGGLLGVTMLVATYKVWPAGFATAAFPFALFGAAMGLSFTGSGRYALGSSCGCPCKEGVCPTKENPTV